MKKVLLFTILFLLVAAVPAMAVTFDNPHGDYTENTDSCSGCHETHDAEVGSLLKGVTDSIVGFCLYCHNGTGSSYNVKDGKKADGSATNGGGFGLLGTEVGSATYTSMHTVNGTKSVGAANGGGGDNADFTCVSCHQPHGSNSARILKTKHKMVSPDGEGTIEATVNGNYFAFNELGKYQEGANEFCGLCHYDYNTEGKGDTGDEKTGTYSEKYRHAVGLNPADLDGNPDTDDPAPAYSENVLPLENNTVSCLTCHKSHSTTVSASGTYSDGQSALLRLPERGVCYACHKWTNDQ